MSTDFKSLLIVMGTTGVTMLVVGPAIYQLSDPTNPHVSVFTQTMDQLLPTSLPYLGTLIGIAVLMSASAATVPRDCKILPWGLENGTTSPAAVGQVIFVEQVDAAQAWLQVRLISCVICSIL